MRLRRFWYFVARNGTLFGAILLALFFYSWNVNFLSLANLRNIGEALSALGVVAIPLSLLVIAGAVDLSVGSVASLAGIVAASVMVSTGSVVAGIAAGLCVGLVAGTINGVLVSYLKFNPIVITLGSLSVWGGLALQVTGGRTVAGLPEGFTDLSLLRFAGIPLEVFILAAAILYGVLVLEFMPYGRRLRAVGGSNRAATSAMADLAEGIQGLVQHMRSEQKMLREWVETQSAQQTELGRLLTRLGESIEQLGRK